MRSNWLLLCAVGCAMDTGDVTVDPGEQPGGGSGSGSGEETVEAIPDVQCAGTPTTGPAGEFNHFSSSVISYGSPKHRGYDLIERSTATTQTIEGSISYSVADKALEDEDVELFACRQSAWEKIGTARTDTEGYFALALTGADRLPIGMRDLYVSVVGDRTGTRFLAFVAPEGRTLIVSDVDGTLTESENAFAQAQVLGGEAAIGHQPGAPEAYAAAAVKGHTLVYVTARGSQYMEGTRTWLAAQGFPRGPLRLSRSFLTLPGDATIGFKTTVLEALSATFEIAAAVGNRHSDVTAYTNADLPWQRIFIKLTEYPEELAADFDTQKAIRFGTYDELRTAQISKL